MSKDILFTPLRLGAIQLPNRIVMAPLTRMRAGPNHAPTAMNAEYYAQRASAGTNCRLAQRDRRGARPRRPHGHADRAQRTKLAFIAVAGGHSAGRSIGN